MIKTSWTALIGVLMATTAATAADLPSRRAPPVYVPPVVAGYSWTGIEFGLTTSYTFPSGQSAVTTAFGGAPVQPQPISLNKSGFDKVGGGVAANYQFTPGSGVVVGGMADASYFNLHAWEDLFTATGKINDQSRLAYLATVNGRLGYAFDHFLVYGVGGLAFGKVHNGTTVFDTTTSYNGSYNGTKTGWDVGGGVEYAIPTDSILNKLSIEKLIGIDKMLGLNMFQGTIRAEFIHYDLGRDTVLVSQNGGPGTGGYVTTFKTSGNLVRVGLGYKFDGMPAAPVVARY